MNDYIIIYDGIEESFTGTEQELHLRLEELANGGACNITAEKIEWEG